MKYAVILSGCGIADGSQIDDCNIFLHGDADYGYYIHNDYFLEYFELSFCIIMIISISNYNSKLFFRNG